MCIIPVQGLSKFKESNESGVLQFVTSLQQVRAAEKGPSGVEAAICI